ncbi:unnamed protein product [Allacma fusca]|uniref:G-protein coupled receptors family 1 profile domain-containing protein n=1 Tax=Allacma fusca TaxID=39272 RepID=A0A8J2LJ08_9HEXA|nr:unnamed protein product [Allacma fusca]
MENSSNTSMEEDDEDEYIFADPRIQAAFILLYSVVFFFCFFGNLTVVLVMRLHWKMRGSTKFCLGNLAFANLCVGIFCVYQDLFMYLIDSWVFGKFLCKMHHFTNNLAHTASILILVVIAIERYFAILDPFKCRRVFTTRRLRLVILGVWIISALICSPRWYYSVTVVNSLPGRNGEPVRYEVICTLLLSIYDSSTAAVIQFLLLFLIPMIIISILYTKIGLFLQHRETFVCSFVQTTGVSDSTDSGQSIPLRDNNCSRRNSGFETFSRKVSFPMEVQLEKIQGQDHYSTCLHPLLTSTCSTCSPRGTRANCRTRCDSVRRAALNRQGSTVSSSSYYHARVRRNSSVVSSVQSPHKGVELNQSPIFFEEGSGVTGLEKCNIKLEVFFSDVMLYKVIRGIYTAREHLKAGCWGLETVPVFQ